MIRRAKERGLDPTGPDGPLGQFTGTVPETALDEETTEHPGRAKHEKSARGRSANTRNGTTVKTVTTDGAGPVTIAAPRDRDGSFEPVLVKKTAAAAERCGRGRAVPVRQGAYHG